jgi:hypothetical protein
LNIPRKTFERQDDDLELEEEPAPSVNHGGASLSATGDLVQFRHEIAVNQNLVFETTAKGDKQCIQDIHVKAKSSKNGNISMLDLASNLANSHRLTLETTNFTDADGSSVQCTLSTPLPAKASSSSGLPAVDWGLATHTRISKNTTLFSRLFSDNVFGQQLVVQTSYHMNRQNEKGSNQQFLLSALGAIDFGSDIGIGLGVTRLFPRQKHKPRFSGSDNSSERVIEGSERAVAATAASSASNSPLDSVELRALCTKSGNHNVCMNANFGSI